MGIKMGEENENGNENENKNHNGATDRERGSQMRRLAALAASRISCYLKELGQEELLRTYAGLLPQDSSWEQLHACQSVYQDELLGELDDEGDDFLGRQEQQRLLLFLRPETEAGEIAFVCVQLAVLYYMERQAGEVFERICKGTGAGATIELAARLVCGDREVLDHFEETREAYRRVELILQAAYPAKQFMTATLRADDRLIDWLNGGTDLSLISPEFLSWYEPESEAEPSFREALLERMTGQFQQMQTHGSEEQICVLAVSGEAYSGRKFLLRQLANRCGMRLLMADAAFLGDMDSLLMQFRKLLREVLIGQVEVAVIGLAPRADMISSIRIMTTEYEKTVQAAWKAKIADAPVRRPLLLTAAEGVKLAPHLNRPVIGGKCKVGDRDENFAAWEYFSTKYLGEGALHSRELTVKMKLPTGRIEQVVKLLVASGAELPIDSREVFRYCYELLDDGRYDNIKRVETTYTYEDLKLEESQKQVIKDICAQVEQRRQVMDDWNLRSRYSYGTCVSALFTGPPGTGKTMAVHVMAGILGLELFKVDLSQIVDKYIGETEKRLEDVFRRAERSNMILFFDEADAVIGKRSEVKEAKDKYANTEVSYLLQRMEEFDGIIIFSSNFSQNIDAAFMRRIRFVIHFPIPDAPTRKEIWQSAFSEQVPQDDINFDYLSNQFEFSGGQIKNVVLNAAFFAAAEGTAVGMKHLLRALQTELTKDANVLFRESLGAYAHYLDE